MRSELYSTDPRQTQAERTQRFQPVPWHTGQAVGTTRPSPAAGPSGAGVFRQFSQFDIAGVQTEAVTHSGFN